MFKKAHEDASKLNAEMQADIDSKKQKVKLLEDVSSLKLRKKLRSLCQILKSSFNENKFN